MLVTSLTITPGSCFAGRTIHCVKTDLGGVKRTGDTESDWFEWFYWSIYMHDIAQWKFCLWSHILARKNVALCTSSQNMWFKNRKIQVSHHQWSKKTVNWWRKGGKKKEKDCALASRVPVESFYSCLSKCVTTSKYSSSEIFSIPRSSHWHRVRGCNFACTRQGRFSKKCA